MLPYGKISALSKKLEADTQFRGIPPKYMAVYPTPDYTVHNDVSVEFHGVVLTSGIVSGIYLYYHHINVASSFNEVIDLNKLTI